MLQQVEEDQGMSYLCITVLTLPDRINRWGKFHFSAWFQRFGFIVKGKAQQLEGVAEMAAVWGRVHLVAD